MQRSPRAPGRAILVSEAARRCRLTPRAIRYYEERGLVDSIRGSAGQRLYDAPILERLAFIGEARDLGLSIRDIHELLDLGKREGRHAQQVRLAQACERILAEIDGRRTRLEGTLRALADATGSARTSQPTGGQGWPESDAA